MRARRDAKFNEWLLQLGDVIIPADNEQSSQIEIPHECIYDGDIISFIFNEKINENNIKYFYNRSILCPKNEDCLKINHKIVTEIITGDSRSDYSVDSVVLTGTENDQSLYPTEFIKYFWLAPTQTNIKKWCNYYVSAES